MKVCLDFAYPRHHTLYNELINYPPDGVEYQISSREIYSTPLFGFLEFLYHNRALEQIRPVLRNIWGSFIRTRMNKDDEKVDLVHVCNNFVARRKDKPWVVDMESVNRSNTGGDFRTFMSQKRKIEKAFLSKYCKKIMPWTNWGRETLETFLDVSGFKDKVEVVYPAMHKVPIQPKPKNGKITVLFMGSINNPGFFIHKGGEYALKCFEILSKKFDVQFVIRCMVPREIKKKYQEFKDLIFIEKALPKKGLEKLYARSDIFLLPGRPCPSIPALESMAFGLPVVAIDDIATAEFIEHGKNGFLTRPVKHILPTDQHRILSVWVEEKTILDPVVVKELVRYLSVLIEDDSLRKVMGRHGRKKIEDGKFSIKVRNRKLKRIYEEAVKK